MGMFKRLQERVDQGDRQAIGVIGEYYMRQGRFQDAMDWFLRYDMLKDAAKAAEDARHQDFLTSDDDDDDIFS